MGENPGSCPNYENIFSPQQFILNIELCGDWGGGKWQPWDQDPFADEWRAKRDRGECQVLGHHSPNDCCSQYIAQSKLDGYLANHSYFDISYLKVYKLKDGPAPPPSPAPNRRRRRSAPAPSPGTCSSGWLEDTDCDGMDLENLAIETAEECCELCSNTTGCGAFTHNIFDGHLHATCYLKASCDESKRSGKRGCTSGVPDVLPPTLPPTTPTPTGMCGASNYLQNTDCAGHDITDKAMATADDCCDWCADTEGCTAFTHNMVDGHGAPHCYLKKACNVEDQGWNGACTSGVGGLAPSSVRRRRRTPVRRRRSNAPGCCSWADNNACGDTTDYCKENEDQCVTCGGHWVPSGFRNFNLDEDEDEMGED